MDNPIVLNSLIALVGIITSVISALTAVNKYKKDNDEATKRIITEGFQTSIASLEESLGLKLKGLEDTLDLRILSLEKHINIKIEDVKKDVAEHRLDMREMKNDFREMIREYDSKAHKRIDEMVHRIKTLEYKNLD